MRNKREKMISTVLKKVTKNVTSTTLARYYSSSFLRSLISLGWRQYDYHKAELKFGHSEKDTKFEKIFHIKFDVTE